MKMNRHVCREFALETLFTWEFAERKKDLLQILEENNEHFFQAVPEELDFTVTILKGVKKHVKDIEKNIVQYAPEWPLDKISLLDRCTLYVGIFELLYSKDVPEIVAINEAVELAKNFGSETSSKFVNGVLNSIYQHLKSEGKEKKLPAKSSE